MLLLLLFSAIYMLQCVMMKEMTKQMQVQTLLLHIVSNILVAHVIFEAISIKLFFFC